MFNVRLRIEILLPTCDDKSCAISCFLVLRKAKLLLREQLRLISWHDVNAFWLTVRECRMKRFTACNSRVRKTTLAAANAFTNSVKSCKWNDNDRDHGWRVARTYFRLLREISSANYRAPFLIMRIMIKMFRWFRRNKNIL